MVFFKRLLKEWETHVTHPGPYMRHLILPIRFFLLVFRQFFGDRCMQRAASLAYTTLLSLIPLMVIFFIFFRFTPTYEILEKRLVDFLLGNLPIASEDVLRTYFSGILGKINIGQLGIVGFLTFLFTSVALLATIERAFNIIWRVGEQRRFVSRFMSYWVILTLGPILVGISFYYSTQFDFSQSLMVIPSDPVSHVFWDQMYSFFFSTLVIILAYILIPNTHIKLWPAVIGGFFASTLWEMTKNGFGHYVREIAVTHKVFGSLGLIPIFLVYLYLTWVVVLVGAELTYSLQNSKRLLQKRFCLREGAVYLEYAALRVILELGRRFSRGSDPATAQDLSEATEVPEEVASFICSALQENRLVATTGDDEDQWIPARDLSHVELNQVIDAIRQHSAKLYPLPKDRESHYFEDLLENVDRKSRELLSGLTVEKTLSDLDQTLAAKV